MRLPALFRAATGAFFSFHFWMRSAGPPPPTAWVAEDVRGTVASSSSVKARQFDNAGGLSCRLSSARFLGRARSSLSPSSKRAGTPNRDAASYMSYSSKFDALLRCKVGYAPPQSLCALKAHGSYCLVEQYELLPPLCYQW